MSQPTVTATEHDATIYVVLGRRCTCGYREAKRAGDEPTLAVPSIERCPSCGAHQLYVVVNAIPL